MRKSRTGVGIQMALALLMPPKGKGAPVEGNQTDGRIDDDGQGRASDTAPPELTGRWDFSRLFAVEAEPEIVAEATESATKVQHLAHDAWRMTIKAALDSASAAVTHDSAAQTTATASGQETAQAQPGDKNFTPKPMSYEEVRLWLQSFNAGPYALLKYAGDVPYKETRDYVPRVMKHYEEDLASSYDPAINASAEKYGLDPQMIRAIMKTESDFQNDCVSHAGARGLLQVMPVVWKDIKDKYDLDWDYNTQVFEPSKNIEVGCAYLAWLRYDFLPRHFAAYDPNPAAPVVLVRDRDNGVPDRESPRIVAKSDSHTPRPDAVETASVDTDVRSANADNGRPSKLDANSPVKTTDVGADESDQPSAKEKPKAETASASGQSEKSANEKADGKSETKSAYTDKSSKSDKRESRIVITDSNTQAKTSQKSSNGKTKVVTRGNGKAVAITVGKGGKVTTKSRSDDKSDQLSGHKKQDVAKVVTREDRDSQGG